MPNPHPIHEHFVVKKRDSWGGGTLEHSFGLLKLEKNTSLIKSHPNALKIFDVQQRKEDRGGA